LNWPELKPRPTLFLLPPHLTALSLFNYPVDGDSKTFQNVSTLPDYRVHIPKNNNLQHEEQQKIVLNNILKYGVFLVVSIFSTAPTWLLVTAVLVQHQMSARSSKQ